MGACARGPAGDDEVRGMSGTASSRYPEWWGGSLLAAEPRRRWAITRQWAVRGLERLRAAQQEPRDAQELMAYARTLEKSMPSLAAELRCLACKER